MGSETESERLLRERYRLTSELGRGGMGRVWKAHDENLNRAVAIKEILFGPGLDEEGRVRAAARARREAQAAAMGAHPNIVTVHDIFEEDGRPWIVMEFLTGCSLFDLVRTRGVRPPGEVARWGLALVDALDTAHRQGITHRDVKPENVMVTDGGRVVLTDFGIATIADTSAVTQTAAIMGSPAYLAPERLSNGPATPAGDLWSLGATLYHAATGISPFRREGVPATLNAILNQEPADRLAPGPLRDAVHGLLAKDPARRLDAGRGRALLARAADPAAPGPRTAAALPPGPATAAPPGGAGPAGTGATRRAVPTGASVPPRPAPEGREGPGGPAPRPARRGGRPSWPVAVLALGLALAVAGVGAVVVLDPWGEGAGARPSDAGSAAPEEPATGEPAEGGAPQESPGPQQAPEQAGMVWTQEPEGFAILVPQGWIRRVSQASVFYDAPDSAAYLQVDRTPHPTDDEYGHVLGQEEATAVRLEGYERVRIEDVTDATPFLSAADWEFTWGAPGEDRRMLARNIAVSPGEYYTVAWASPAGPWAGHEDMRNAALEGFAPA
ncbi:protein kinase domain-containing protein [Nocardiopsis flavescens]